MAGCLVHEGAGVLDDRAQLAANLLDVPGGPVQPIVQFPILQQEILLFCQKIKLLIIYRGKVIFL